MTIRNLAAAAAALITLLAGAAVGAETVSSIGIVEQVETTPGQMRVELSGIDQIFSLATGRAGASDAAVAAIRDSEASHNSVTLFVDLASGRIDGPTRRPVFQVSGVTYLGTSHVVPVAPRRSGRIAPAEADLAAGLALQQDGRAAEARSRLDRALAAPRLAADLRAIGLKARAAVLTDLAWSMAQEPTTEGDSLLVQALADNRAWQAAEPESTMAAVAVADSRQDLGDFNAALADYATIIQRWPEAESFAGVRRGAIYRRMGDYARALAELDAITAHVGHQDGMRFHYHRGWTLNQLGRFDEAIVEFGEGLDYQPDYLWALVKRACAFGQVGRVVDAARDMRRAADLASAQPDTVPTPSSRAQRGWLAEVAARLDGLAAAARPGTSDAACGTPWRGPEANRQRSPLLGPPAS